MTLVATIFVCVAALAPGEHCGPSTADWLERVPGEFVSPIGCLVGGQSYAAGSSRVPHGATFSVVCGRDYARMNGTPA